MPEEQQIMQPRKPIVPIIVGIAVVIVIIGAVLLLKNKPKPEEPAIPTEQTEQQTGNEQVEPLPVPALGDTGIPETEVTEEPEQTEQTESQPTITTQPTTQRFAVVAKNFSFSVGEIKVKKGDTVKIAFDNQEGFHDWVLDEFSARTQKLQAGQKKEISFIADKTGTFEYYCSVGEHRKLGMKGNLIVE